MAEGSGDSAIEGSTGLIGYIFPTRSLVPIILIGLLVRLAIAPWMSWTYDMYPFYIASVDTLYETGLYSRAIFSYPPLFPVILYPFVLLLSLFLDPGSFGAVHPSMVDVAGLTGMITPFVTHPAFNLTVKLPLIIADLGMGLMLFHLVRGIRDEAWGSRVFILWFLNPLVIWVSSVAGQFDVIPAALVLAGMICFLRNRYLLCGFVLGLGALFKVYPIYILLFVFALAILEGKRLIEGKGLRNAGSIVVGAIASAVTVIPFLVSSPLMLDFVFRRVGTLNFGGFSLWFAGPLVINELTSLLVPYGVIVSIVLLIASILVILSIAVRCGSRDASGMDRTKAIMLGGALVIAAVLLIQPVSNPQHLLWILPFLLVLLTWWEGRAERKIILLTVCGLLYFIGLQSICAFLYPMAGYTHLLSVEALSDHIVSYFTAGGLVTRRTWVIGSAMVGAITLLSTLLPERLDPIERVWGYLRRRWKGGD